MNLKSTLIIGILSRNSMKNTPSGNLRKNKVKFVVLFYKV